MSEIWALHVKTKLNRPVYVTGVGCTNGTESMKKKEICSLACHQICDGITLDQLLSQALAAEVLDIRFCRLLTITNLICCISNVESGPLVETELGVIS